MSRTEKKKTRTGSTVFNQSAPMELRPAGSDTLIRGDGHSTVTDLYTTVTGDIFKPAL